MFVVLEGIDGAGKTSQIERLAEFLKAAGQHVTTCSDPGTTAAGAQIRQILLARQDIPLSPKTELLLFMAARAQLVQEVIAPALAANHSVICDRFLLSSVVYQGHLAVPSESAGQPHANAVTPEAIWQLGQFVIEKTRPDLIIVLDLPANIAAGRAKAKPDRIESRGSDYLEKVRQGFLTEARHYPDWIQVLDATQSPAEVAQAIQACVSQRMPSP